MTDMVHGARPVAEADPILPRWWRTVDHWTLTCVLILFGIGLLLGLASSPPLAERHGLNPFHYVQRQAFFGGLALIFMVIISMMAPQTVRRLGMIGFLLAFVAVVFLPLFGTDFGKGAVRWYSLGFGAIQPSEFLKPCFMVATAWLVAASLELDGPPGRTWSFAVCLSIVLMLALQPDFGQASLVLFGWGVVYFVSGSAMLPLILVAGLAILGGVIAYRGSDHFAGRIDAFFSSDLDPTTQLGYATDAIRSGGLLGAGVGEGRVKWSLPDAHTDFIIAVAAEEYGLILVLVIIGLYAAIVVRSLTRLVREQDAFIRLAGTGLCAIVAVQAMINLGVAVRLLPAKGMTLPFVSYGGSSVLASGLALGMLLAFTRSRPQGRLSTLLKSG